MVELFSTVMIWGLSFALAKKALNHLHPLELVTVRLLLAAMTATAIQRFFGGGHDSGSASGVAVPSSQNAGSSRTFLPAVILGVFEFAGTYILYTWSLKYLPSGVVGTLTLLTPVITFVVALAARVQNFRLGALAGTVLSVIGAFLCLPPTAQVTGFLSSLNFSHEVIVGLSLIMASNFMFALGNVAISKFQRERKFGAYSTPQGLWIGGALSLVICVVSGAENHEHDLTLGALALPLYLGVVATGVGFYLWNRGVEKTSALKASFVGNFKAPLSLVWGAVLLGETLNTRLVFGLLLLLAATQLVRGEAAQKYV